MGSEVKEMKIMLDSIAKIKEFVAISAKFESDMDLVSDRYVVDAKSIMGIMSLDLSAPLTLRVHCKGECEGIKDALKGFIVK